MTTKYARALDRKLLTMRNKPGRIPRRAPVIFMTAEEKACYLDGAAREEASLPEIKALAAVVKRCPYPQRAQELFDFVRRNVDYRLDPDGEEYEDSVTGLIEGQDDCDGTAKILVALCIAADLEACVRAVMRPGDTQVDHFQAMIRWPGSTSHPNALPGGWLLADTTLEGVALGQGAEAAEARPDGTLIDLREVAPGQYGPVLRDLRRG